MNNTSAPPYSIPRQLMALIAGNRGRIVSAVTGAAAWGIAQLVTSKGLNMPGELATAISTACGLAAGWLVDNIGARLNAAGISQIQDALPGVKTDGAALPLGQTVQAVNNLTGTMPEEMAANVKPVTLNELQEMRPLLAAVFQTNPSLLHSMRQAIQKTATAP